MKKLLFVLMLVIMGNTFATSRNTRNTRTVNRVTESDRREIEQAVEKNMEPLIEMVIATVMPGLKEESAKFEINGIFDKDYIISDSLKKEIGKRYIDEVVKITINGMRPRVAVKKINYIAQNKVEVNFDMKIKKLDKGWDILEMDDEMERRFLIKAGVKDMGEVDKVMKSRGNDELKKKYYHILLDEMSNRFNEKFKNTKEEEDWVSDLSVKVNKVNGKWQAEDLDN